MLHSASVLLSIIHVITAAAWYLQKHYWVNLLLWLHIMDSKWRKTDFCCETVDNSVPATHDSSNLIEIKLAKIHIILFIWMPRRIPVAKQNIGDPANSIFGDPIRKQWRSELWNIPYRSETIPEEQAFLTVSVLRRSVSSLGQDFQLGGVKGCSLPVGGCLSILWVHTTDTHIHTHALTHTVLLSRWEGFSLLPLRGQRWNSSGQRRLVIE